MKRGIKNFAIATMVGVASLGLMTGCVKDDKGHVENKPLEDKPYIQVVGLDTGYIVGETLNVEGAKILYYSNLNDTTADEITITESMIANFSTEEAGSKVLKVIWNGFELEIDYSVISTNDFINIYNAAFDNIMNAKNVHADIVRQDSEQLVASTNVKNNKFYASFSQNGEFVGEEWVEKYNNNWFYYELKGADIKSRRNINEEIENDNFMEFVIGSFIMTGSRLTVEGLSGLNGFSIDFKNGKTIWKVNPLEEENQIAILEYTIENEKIIKCDWTVYNQNQEVTIRALSTISYNAEDVEMVDLPTDIAWEDIT